MGRWVLCPQGHKICQFLGESLLTRVVNIGTKVQAKVSKHLLNCNKIKTVISNSHHVLTNGHPRLVILFFFPYKFQEKGHSQLQPLQ